MPGGGEKVELEKEAEERSHEVQRICDHVATGSPGRGCQKPGVVAGVQEAQGLA